MQDIATVSRRMEDDFVFIADAKFRENANIQSFDIFEEAKRDPQAFWAKQADCLQWFQPWSTVLAGSAPYFKWFEGGKLNACYNCLDRHMSNDNRLKVALIWEGEKGDERRITYEELFHEVNQLSNVLKSLGIQKGDKVAIYLPMIPEAVIAMLSCARIGAVHAVVFGGFSADSLKDRILDAEAKLVITADGGYRRGGIIPLKAAVDEAVKECSCVEHVLVIKYANQQISMNSSRDRWYHELMKNASAKCPAEEMDSEDMLYILYTSGTTGKPKGIIHTTGGYMVGAAITTRWVFDIKPNDIFWCTADIGWVTGHTYVVYGPLSNGMTILMYEGALDWPERDRCWKLVEKHQVTILYTAPTAIRMFRKWGEQWPQSCNLSSLRLLGSVGEPINPEAWIWYYTYIGQEKCPVVDTWWQTETGSIMISPIPGLTPLKPGSAACPLPGANIAILNDNGKEFSSGYLAITFPWPSMLRGIHKDPKRYEETYWKKWENQYYFTGDGAEQDDSGYYWLMGRIDDVINVAGHRLGTREIESAIVDYQGVAEAAVITVSDAIRGQAIVSFTTLREGLLPNVQLEESIKDHVVKKIGGIARPKKIIFIYDLPKTRSGKIMRRLLRDLAEGRILGDISTLLNPALIEDIKEKYREFED